MTSCDRQTARPNKATVIRYHTAIYASQHRHESPTSRLRTTEASICGERRQRTGIEWVRSRRSRKRTITYASISPPLARSVIQRCRNKHFSGQRSNSVAADGTQQNQRSAASAEATVILRSVKGSSNAYPPLKCIAENLCFILDNCEV